MQIALRLLPLLAVAACGQPDPNARETSGEKTEWSILQGIEFQARSKATTSGSFQTVEGYDVLGVVGADNKMIWIMLKPMSPPYYKQLPIGNYTVSKELVAKLVAENRLGYTTEQVLASRVAAQ